MSDHFERASVGNIECISVWIVLLFSVKVWDSWRLWFCWTAAQIRPKLASISDVRTSTQAQRRLANFSRVLMHSLELKWHRIKTQPSTMFYSAMAHVCIIHCWGNSTVWSLRTQLISNLCRLASNQGSACWNRFQSPTVDSFDWTKSTCLSSDAICTRPTLREIVSSIYRSDYFSSTQTCSTSIWAIIQ